MKDTLNRSEIRSCLRAYLTARMQHEQILKDSDIQHWFKVGNDTEANRLIAERYPYGKWEQVHWYALNLIEAMYRCSPVKVEPAETLGTPRLV
jgi:hypothetical protein